MAQMNPVAMISKLNVSYKVISPPPFPFRIRGEEVAAVAFGDSLMGIISASAEDGNRDTTHTGNTLSPCPVSRDAICFSRCFGKRPWLPMLSLRQFLCLSAPGVVQVVLNSPPFFGLFYFLSMYPTGKFRYLCGSQNI